MTDTMQRPLATPALKAQQVRISEKLHPEPDYASAPDEWLFYIRQIAHAACKRRGFINDALRQAFVNDVTRIVSNKGKLGQRREYLRVLNQQLQARGYGNRRHQTQQNTLIADSPAEPKPAPTSPFGKPLGLTPAEQEARRKAALATVAPKWPELVADKWYPLDTIKPCVINEPFDTQRACYEAYPMLREQRGEDIERHIGRHFALVEPADYRIPTDNRRKGQPIPEPETDAMTDAMQAVGDVAKQMASDAEAQREQSEALNETLGIKRSEITVDQATTKKYMGIVSEFADALGVPKKNRDELWHTFLGVESLHDWAGTFDAAVAKTKAEILDSRYPTKDQIKAYIGSLFKNAGRKVNFQSATNYADYDAALNALQEPSAVVAKVAEYLSKPQEQQESSDTGNAEPEPKKSALSKPAPKPASKPIDTDPFADTDPFMDASEDTPYLRMALVGPAGSGKTYTALRIASSLIPGGKVALIDTERGSAAKYRKDFNFKVLKLESYDPRMYISAINAASRNGYDVLIIDSLSHAWEGQGGVLELHDNAVRRQSAAGNKENSFTAWREVTPLHNELVDTMLNAPIHIIVTLRAKTEYVQENGRVRKIGLAPIQRPGLEYEFDIVADLDQDNTLIVGKTRCSALNQLVQKQAGREVADKISQWLTA